MTRLVSLWRIQPVSHEACRLAVETPAEFVVAKRALVDVFTPARPKIGGRWLTGRRVELDRIVAAVLEERRHVVLYSERGRGKTSLANAAVELLRSRGAAVARFTCRSGSSFEEIVRGLLRDLPRSLLVVSAGQPRGEGCEAALPKDRFDLADLTQVPSQLMCQDLVCVIDEYDRVDSASVRSQIADAVKQLSDRGSRFVFILIGVSKNLDELLGEHHSIRRNIVPIALPMLSLGEIGSMLVSGADQAGFDVPAALVERVAAFSHGMPYIAQSLALRMLQMTAARAGTVVSDADLKEAAERLIEEADPGVTLRYAALAAPGPDQRMASDLLIIAAAEQDRYGRLRAVQDQEWIELTNGRVALGSWQRAIEAGVLRPERPGDTLIVTPVDRDLLSYVLLLALASPRSMNDTASGQGAFSQAGQSRDTLIEPAYPG